MKKPITPTVIDLKPEQKERLRGAMRILVEYLLEKGHLTPPRQQTTTVGQQGSGQVLASSTITDIDKS